ncbi:cytochrome c oxidase subunit II [Allobacillus sp. GCM10007491]|uniref:Cytochrome c oxidase subunit 2 n=2 Tax=Allobacillus TaxID=1400133 RepID=A0A941HRV1_9BACI|nr:MULTISPECIES: cytochrome c oxidase subunit II [Allobacillus]MBR7552758.1 cytochrome c oxidase subunit II [Allobacillus saliphilus]TSJ65384.1 cytochrome c oxidase subunit II [Allobacillus salarius]
MKGLTSKFKAVGALMTLALILSGCGEEFLSALRPQGQGASDILSLMILSIAVMMFVFVVVMVIYVFVILKFRQKKGQEDFIPEQVEGSHTLETLWTVVPIFLILILAVPTVQYTFSLVDTSPQVSAEGEEDQIWINVTGKQYWWHFEYDGMDVTTSQELYIPTDRRVFLSLHSEDVIHSFWVPTLQGKIDVNPTGNRNEIWIDAEKEGVYWGKCAEFCGPSHSLMDFKVVAVSPGEFEQWVKDMRNIDPEATPESEVAAAGQEVFANNCMSCHANGTSPNKIGPNVSNFGDRERIAGVLEYNKENLIEWIETKGKDMKPGNLMTSAAYDLSDEELEQVAEYLMSLSPSEITPENANDNEYIESDLSDLFVDEEKDESSQEKSEEESEEDSEEDSDSN